MTQDQKRALMIGGVGIGILVLLHLSRPSGISGNVAGIDPSTLGGGTGTTGVAGINPATSFPIDFGGNPVYPPINIPPIPPVGYNAPQNVGPDYNPILNRILAALSGLGGSAGCCPQAPATIYLPPTPMLPPPVPASALPPPVPTYPAHRNNIIVARPNTYFGGGNALIPSGGAQGPSLLQAGYLIPGMGVTGSL